MIKKILMVLLCLGLASTANAATKRVQAYDTLAAPAAGDWLFLSDVSDSGREYKIPISAIYGSAITSGLSPVFAGVVLGTASTTQGSVILYSNVNNYGVLLNPAATPLENVTIKLPASYPAGNNYLWNMDANGVTDFTDPASFLAPTGAGGSLTVTATGFDGNLAPTDNTIQEIAQKFDDFVGGAGTDDQTAAEVPIADAGSLITGINVETALQELAGKLADGVDGAWGLSLKNNTTTFAPASGYDSGYSVIGNNPYVYYSAANHRLQLWDTDLDSWAGISPSAKADVNADTTGEAGSLGSTATTGKLAVTGPGAGATRTMTTPDANFTVARTDAGNTFTGDQTVNGVIRADVSFNSYTAAQTLTEAAHNSGVVQMTTADEVTLWDCETANIGNTVLLWARDAEKIEVVPASGDHFNLFAGTALTANNELDVAATAGTKVTLMCTADDTWSVFHETAASTDGGAAE